MSLDEMLGAIRAADGDDPELAAMTQLRLRRSLEVRARGRHQLAGLMTAVAILFGATVSWALATGHIRTLWAPGPQVREAPVEVAPPPRSASQRRADQPSQALATVPSPAPPPEAVTPEAAPLPEAAPPPPPVSAPIAPPRPPVPRRIAPPSGQPVEALYRSAHQLHFHGGDPSVALAAWDAYLAAEPDGRFSIEARYNRAIVLVRLRRYAEARAALLPFARGDVELGGYRQTEAEQLVERLARVR